MDTETLKTIQDALYRYAEYTEKKMREVQNPRPGFKINNAIDLLAFHQERLDAITSALSVVEAELPPRPGREED